MGEAGSDPRGERGPLAAHPHRALLLGADGFIGRQIAYTLRQLGWEVTCAARRTARLAAMGFETFQLDLESPEAAREDTWAEPLADMDALINCAGLLTGSDARFDAVHLSAPEAAYKARPAGCHAILISAVGIDKSDTRFASYRRGGEALALRHGAHVLRPGLVMGDTSYGGTSLARALAAIPFVTPVVGDGSQEINPIHAADLAQIIAAMIESPPPPGVHDIGGPEKITQAELLTGLRAWMGLRPARLLHLPVPLARAVGRIGDAMRLGPISSTFVDQLQEGTLADPVPLTRHLRLRPRGFSVFANARPAGTQDLWHARLYLIRPLLRVVLALMWLASGLIGLFLPADQFLPLIDAPGPELLWTALARLGGLADLAIAGALFAGLWPKRIAAVQAAVVVAYTLAFTALAPALWLLPLGGLLKNLPILALIALSAILEDER